MSSEYFVAVDWGTSTMKAFLCRYLDGAAEPLDSVEGPGVGQLQGPIEEALFACLDPWLKTYGKLPLLLSGMAGSNIGWVATPYVPCPVAPVPLFSKCHAFKHCGHQVVIVPGAISRENDLMRGEELQIFGWLRLQGIGPESKSRDGDHLICLPGTHTKWVLLHNGKIETFMTALTGELFALLQEHSVLVPKKALSENSESDKTERKKSSYIDNPEAFLMGVGQLLNAPEENLIHQLFRVRSQQICGKLLEADARAYLSGLLIGADVIGAVKKYQPLLSAFENGRSLSSGNGWKDLERPAHKVTLLGNKSLCGLFSDALAVVGYESEICDVTEITLAGFAAVYEAMIR
ncbi:MAG: 2-dehydro-3-deoxygalactonokinase [Exilibacterium sp.]